MTRHPSSNDPEDFLKRWQCVIQSHGESRSFRPTESQSLCKSVVSRIMLWAIGLDIISVGCLYLLTKFKIHQNLFTDAIVWIFVLSIIVVMGTTVISASIMFAETVRKITWSPATYWLDFCGPESQSDSELINSLKTFSIEDLRFGLALLQNRADRFQRRLRDLWIVLCIPALAAGGESIFMVPSIRGFLERVTSHLAPKSNFSLEYLFWGAVAGFFALFLSVYFRQPGDVLREQVTLVKAAIDCKV